ncbi:MAG TPA: DUF2336 domain-containing protein [Xanthobacteraceae bacterium]|nr:DUF2336 domain-containing protein [Xanthobacteraceae bacterium]
MTLPSALIDELESAVRGSSSEKRNSTLQRVTDLFLNGAENFSHEQIDLFDDVLMHLIKRVEAKVLAELSAKLAPSPNAPTGVIRHLARHDDILVAGPVLTQSERLAPADLIEIAKTKGQAHLLAIADRSLLDETITDVMLERGSKEVFHKLAQNHGAFFSKSGFTTLVNYAKSDEILAEKVGQRIDVPSKLLQDLVLKATDSVRSRLLATAPAEVHAEIKRTLASISNEVIQEVEIETRDFKRARDLVLALHKKNQLNEAMLSEFAKNNKYEEMVAAFALLCSARFELVERLMRTSHYGGLLVAGKAADLKWPTMNIILTHRLPQHPISNHELEQAKTDFAKLTRPTSQRLLGFWQARPASAPT